MKIEWTARVISLLILAAVAMLFLGCKSVQYVPIETVKRDSVYLTRVDRDSILVRDSVYVERGDTIKVVRYKWLERYKTLRDTAYIERIRKVDVPYPVERKLSKWEKVKMDFGGLAIGGLLVAIAYLIWRIFLFVSRKR